MAGVTGRFFPIVGFSMGQYQTFDTFDAPELSNAGIPPYAGSLGQVIEQDGKAFRLVQFDNGAGNVAAAAGHPAYWKDRSAYIVTSDSSDSESGINGVAGGFLMAATDQYYCMIQLGGLQTITTDGNVVKGDALIGSSTDGQFDPMHVGSATWLGQPVGIANADDSSTVGTMYWILGNQL